MRTTPVVVLAALVGQTQRCGPSPQEVGIHVLLAAPVMVLIMTLFLLLLAHLWRRTTPALEVTWRPTLLLLFTTVVLAGAALGVLGMALHARSDALEASLSLATIILAAVGGGYATVVLLVWRLWFRRRPAAAFSLVQLPIAVLFVAPAIVLTIDLSQPVGDALYQFYDTIAQVVSEVWPASVAIALALLAEPIVRARRARKLT